MKRINEHPTLVIEYPDGTLVKIYQQLSMEYIKELLDEVLKQPCSSETGKVLRNIPRFRHNRQF